MIVGVDSGLDRLSMRKILYICASPYSGSTLLSFLLNTHPDVISIGHSTGWDFGENKAFRCSCGEFLVECPFFAKVAEDFRTQDLPFEFRNFGTEYRLAGSDRLNRMLTGRLPLLPVSSLEHVRDSTVKALPGLGARLRRQDLANARLFASALDYNGSSVFVDNSHDPYRMRHLRRIPGFQIYCLHLIRDPRGVALSNAKHKGWDVRLSAKLWLQRQADIVRIAGEFPRNTKAFYEDLCESLHTTLADVFEFMGLSRREIAIEDFRATEHHILGNDMRLRPANVMRDDRWRKELSVQKQQAITQVLEEFVAARPDDPTATIVARYLPQRLAA